MLICDLSPGIPNAGSTITLAAAKGKTVAEDRRPRRHRRPAPPGGSSCGAPPYTRVVPSVVSGGSVGFLVLLAALTGGVMNVFIRAAATETTVRATSGRREGILPRGVRRICAPSWPSTKRTRPHQGIAQRVPDSECHAPLVTATDSGAERIRRKPVLGGLINEYTHTA